MDLHDTVRRMEKEVDRLRGLLGATQEELTRYLARLQQEQAVQAWQAQQAPAGQAWGRDPASEDGDPWVAYA